MSEKLDGGREYWTGELLFLGWIHTFATPAWFPENFPSVPLDRELWGGRYRQADTARIVRRQTSHDGWKSARSMIFDTPQAKGGFEQRLAYARAAAFSDKMSRG